MTLRVSRVGFSAHLPVPAEKDSHAVRTDCQKQQVLQQSRKLNPAPLGEMLDNGLPSFVKDSFQKIERLSFCLHQLPSAVFAVQAPSPFQSANGELAKAI